MFSTDAPEDAQAFAAPWEASAFALRAYLVETGVIDADRFAHLLADALRANPAAVDDGTAYFVAFVDALERAVAPLASAEEFARERDAWRHAAAITPHGDPILLKRRT